MVECELTVSILVIGANMTNSTYHAIIELAKTTQKTQITQI